LKYRLIYSFCKEYNKKEGDQMLLDFVAFMFTTGLFAVFIGSFAMILSILIFAFQNGN
jgi:hypothetical protein